MNGFKAPASPEQSLTRKCLSFPSSDPLQILCQILSDVDSLYLKLFLTVEERKKYLWKQASISKVHILPQSAEMGTDLSVTSMFV